MGIILLPIIAYMVFLSSSVQTYFTQTIAAKLSKRANTTIQIEGVDFSPFKSLILKGVYIEDYQKDTLMYVGALKAQIDSADWEFHNFNLNVKKLYLKKITLDKTYFRLYEDENTTLNIDKLIDSLSTGGTSESEQEFLCTVNQVDMTRSRFAYYTEEYKPQKFGMNYDDIDVLDIQLQARNIVLEGDTLNFDLQKLSCRDKSGFILKELKAHNRITNRQWSMTNVSILTPYSKAYAKHINFNYISGEGYWKNFTKKMKLDFVFKTSRISLLDIAYFNDELYGFQETGYFSGRVHGTVVDLKGKNIDIQYGDNTHIKGQFYMNGLPYLRNAYLEANFKEFTTSIPDIEKVYIPGYEKGRIAIPQKFDNLGLIRYKGKFNGFINDFVFYGNFKTDMGTIKTDILFKPSPEENKLSFKGDLKTTDFNLGGLLDVEKAGRITMNVEVNGYTSDKKLRGKLRGMVNQLEFYNYDYINLALDGDFSENKFDGKISLLDPNIAFDFSGKVDFSHKVPTLNFSSHLSNAQLYPLHLNTKDSLAQLSLSLNANFTGSGLDDANGVIEVNNTHYRNNRGEFKLKKIVLNSNTTPHYKNVIFSSDVADAEVKGNYDVRELISSLKNIVFYYLPAYATNKEYTKLDTTNKFDFKVDLKETQALTDVLYPELEIAANSTISGKVNAQNHILEINAYAPDIVWMGKTLDGLQFNLKTNNEKLIAKGRTNKLKFSDSFRIYNLSHKLEAGNNNLKYNLLWNNWDEVTYSGYLAAESKISRKNPEANPLTEIQLLPSTIIMADSIWNIQPSKITIDSTSFAIDNFKIQRNKQFFGLDGVISEQKSDSLTFQFEEITLSDLNSILGSKGIALNGKLRGYLQIADFYHDRLSSSNLVVEELVFNRDTLGNLYLMSDWDKINQKLFVSSFTHHKGRKEINLFGDYFPQKDSLDFRLDINQFRLPLLQSYLQENISELSGYTSGHINLTGTTSTPQMEGKLHLDNAGFTVNELQTHYQCNDSITLTPTQVRFEQMQLFDTKGHKASLDGFIQHDNFDKLQLDLALNAVNFQVLNTKITDNEMLYGKAYITGITHISGKPEDLNIEITAKTEKDTKIYIPLNSSSDIQESNFITFVNKHSTSTYQKKEDYQINLSGIRMNCDFDITPDADVQIIFDSRIGDILRAKGNGNLNLQIDTKGDFKIFGGYTIENGSYLFTLQDVINKKFDLENGGTIKWNGDPYNARVNINALYKVRTSLYDLGLNIPDVDVTKKVPVQCKMNLSNRLTNPNIRFSIEFPTLDQQTQNIVEGLFASEDEVNKQILSLLVLNRFYTPEYVRATDQDFENKNSSYAVGVTTSELLSNQLSNWLSQISNDFDIGVSYRPGDELTSDEIEVALSTQIFNDKVTINGNVGTRSNQERDNDFIGDFDVNVKLDKKGKLQFKAFTRSNEKLLYEDKRNTQGIGIFYREDFDSFSQLLKKYLNFLRKKDHK
ncbi:MAG: translocation/assembly module TamB domain-containing protein [Marinifilaceae bacterium]